MAFGGVETGSMKQMLAPKVAPRAGSMGLMPAARLTAMATGTTMLADAVFDVISESAAAKHVNRMVNGNGWCDGTQLVTAWPMLAARPVENAMDPSARPPPKRKTVPQSMRTA